MKGLLLPRLAVLIIGFKFSFFFSSLNLVDSIQSCQCFGHILTSWLLTILLFLNTVWYFVFSWVSKILLCIFPVYRDILLTCMKDCFPMLFRIKSNNYNIHHPEKENRQASSILRNTNLRFMWLKVGNLKLISGNLKLISGVHEWLSNFICISSSICHIKRKYPMCYIWIF